MIKNIPDGPPEPQTIHEQVEREKYQEYLRFYHKAQSFRSHHVIPRPFKLSLQRPKLLTEVNENYWSSLSERFRLSLLFP